MLKPSSTKTGGKDLNLKKADPSTIQDKFLVGYQGWFTCAGDGEPVNPGHHGWLHWFNSPLPDGGRPNFDLCPDVSDYSPSELYPAPGLKTANGEQLCLFSSRHPKTVERHFHWMAEHGVDGAFLQRFLGQCDLDKDTQGIRRIRDEVGARVKEAAEKEGRVFAIMYDISGVDPDRILQVIQRDWNHLVRQECVLDSPNYLREKGKAVVAIWGFGFDNARHTPEIIRDVNSFIRANTPDGAYIMGGAPSKWRTCQGDADTNPGIRDAWLTEFDAISPWTIGRYSNEDEADRFANERMKGDMELLRTRSESKRIDYVPVVFPGGSGYNLSEGKWGFNDIKRNGGRFLWRQIFNARHLGARIIYGAMWDEYDEGTAFLPAIPNKRLLPVHEKFPFLALDAEGHDLPSDWYMRICGLAAESLRHAKAVEATFPSKELQDYWATRPKFEGENENENRPGASCTSKPKDGDDDGNALGSYQAWLASQQEDKEETAPPPYCLVEEGGTVLLPPDEVSTPNTLEPQAGSLIGGVSAQIPTSHTSSAVADAYACPSRPMMEDPMTSLTSNFGRQSISELPNPYSSSSHQRPPSSSPSSRPPTRPGSARPSSTRPQQPGIQCQIGSSRPQFSSPPIPEEPQSSGPWSQASWPPPEWNLPPQQVASNSNIGSYQQYQATGSSSRISSPESLHFPLGTPALRPHSPAPGLPYSGNAPPQFPMPAFGDPSSLPSSPGGSPNQPYPFPSAYPGQMGPEGLPYENTTGYQPHEHSNVTPYPPIQFPLGVEGYQGPHGPGYFPPPPQHPHYGSHGHPGPHHGAHHHGAHHQMYQPSGYHHPPHAGPGYVVYAPPPTSAAGSAINLALNAVGKVAGHRTQMQLQQTLNKFNL